MNEKKKSEEPNGEKNSPETGIQNYQHVTGEIEALRAMLKKSQLNNKTNAKDDENHKPDKD